VTKIQRRLLTGATVFGVVANLSTMLYTFTGYFWWVPAPHPTDRYFLVTSYHVAGHIVGLVAFLILATRTEPKPPVPPPPVTLWKGDIVNDHDPSLGAGWVVVQAEDGSVFKARCSAGWSKMRTGFKVFGTCQNGLHELQGIHGCPK